MYYTGLDRFLPANWDGGFSALVFLLTFLGVLWNLSLCIPGAFYIRFNTDGMAIRHSFYVRRLQWNMVTGISEICRKGGRSGPQWGVLVSVPKRGIMPADCFIRDCYTTDRSELLRVMRDLWTRANT